jgi:hypothetical protein
MYTGRILNEAEISDVDRIVTNGDGTPLDLEASLRVVNHSPTGFCWGYQGSGPAQLALAILLDHFGGDVVRAKSLYQDFKSKVIARLDMDSDFVLTDEQVENAITAIDVERMQRA